MIEENMFEKLKKEICDAVYGWAVENGLFNEKDFVEFYELFIEAVNESRTIFDLLIVCSMVKFFVYRVARREGKRIDLVCEKVLNIFNATKEMIERMRMAM